MDYKEKVIALLNSQELSKEQKEKLEVIFPELKDEDERIRKEIIDFLKLPHHQFAGKRDHEKWIAWLEKQGEKKGYTFKPIPRLLDMIVPSEKAKFYCQKLINTLTKEGYDTDAKIVCNRLKQMNGEDVAMATMDEVEKQGENKPAEDNKMRQEILELVSISGIDYNQYEEIKDWLEKQGKKSTIIDIDKMVMEYSQTKDGDFGLPVNCMIRAYRKGIIDALSIALNIEKQGEKKPTYKVEPKFKVGDWIVNNVCFPMHIASIKDGMYIFTKGDAISVSFIDENYHLWTIEDAKDGDVLTTDNFIFIFKSIDNNNGVHYYCHYEISKHEDDSPRFGIALSQSLMGIVGGSFTHYKPTTKNQRDTLFAKMKEAGYKWNSEKKELKKIEPKILGADNILPYLGNNQVQDILEDMGMLDDNGQCPHTAEEIFKAGMEHAFNLNREATSSIKLVDADKVIEWLKPLHYGGIIDGIINKFKKDFGL